MEETEGPMLLSTSALRVLTTRHSRGRGKVIIRVERQQYAFFGRIGLEMKIKLNYNIYIPQSRIILCLFLIIYLYGMIIFMLSRHFK